MKLISGKYWSISEVRCPSLSFYIFQLKYGFRSEDRFVIYFSLVLYALLVKAFLFSIVTV